MMQLLLIALLASFAAVYGTSSAEPELIYNCDVDYAKWGCNPAKLKQGDGWKCSMNDTEMQGRLMSWATWPVDSDCYEVTAGDEANPSTSYIPSDAQLPQYTYINIRTVCYGLAFRGLLMYAVNETGDKVGDWNIPADATIRWKQPWANIPGHTCEKALMHASGMIKPYFTRYRFEAPLAGQGKLTFKVLIKQGDANEGAFFRPQNVLQLTEAPASLPDPIFVQTAAGQTCNQFCQEKLLDCDRDALALLNSSVALNQKLVRTVPCNMPFLASSIAGSSYADPATGMCYYTQSASCEVQTGNQFCACMEPYVSGSSTLGPKISTLFAASALLFFLNKRFAMVALVMIYLIGFSEAHNWLGTVSRALGASTINPCKQSRTGSPHVQIGPNQNFSITFFQAHGGWTYFSLVALEDVPKLGKMTNAQREKYINAALPQHHTNITSGKYQKFNLNNLATNNTLFQIAPFARRINNTDPLWFPEGEFGPKSKAGFNRAINNMYMYTIDQNIGDKWVTYDNPEFPHIKSMWKFKNTAVNGTQKDLAQFKLPSNLPYGRYVIQYSWSGYYDCVDIDYVNHNVELIYGTRPLKPNWVRVDHCTVRNPRMSFPSYGPEEVVHNADTCKRKMEPLMPQVNTAGEQIQVSIVVASNLTAYHAYNFKRYADARGNWTVKNFAFPAFPGAEAVFPIEVTGGWNTSYTFNYMQEENKDKFFCWGAVPPEFTTTTDIYFTTDDPLDPVFYSTCWVLNNENTFADVVAPTEIDTNWRYNEKCVSCSDKSLITQLDTIPLWKPADECRNCDLEPADPTRDFPGLRPKVDFALVANHSRCDGFISNATMFGTFPSYYNTCSSTAEAMGCWKNLFSTNQKMSDSSAAGASVSKEDCAVLVDNDPECSSIFIALDADNGANRPQAASCVCMTKKSCCGKCRVATNANGIDSVSQNGVHIYETKSIADPGCVTGVKSADNTFCCASTCKACRVRNAPSTPAPAPGSTTAAPPVTTGRSTPSPTPAPTETPRPNLTVEQLAAGYRSVELCKDARTPLWRTCDKYAPPCFI